MTVEFWGSRPDAAQGAISRVRTTLKQLSSARFRAAYAYATHGGVDQLLKLVRPAERWADVSKLVLLGLHNGITEPVAIETLLREAKCEVRVIGPMRLTPNTLRTSPIFHAKLVAVDGPKGGTRCLQVGSANLTNAAIGDLPRNYESVLSISGPGSAADAWIDFESWWERCWTSGRKVTARFLESYAAAREDLVRGGPSSPFGIDMPSAADASMMFIEVGAASGPPNARHQVEFPERLAEFFGPPIEGRRNLTLTSAGNAWSGRPLSHKTTSLGVNIWRLGMPTIPSGGAPIAHRVISFERTSSGTTFAFTIADEDSKAHRAWISAASRHGHLGVTGAGSGRAFGIVG